MDTWDEGLELCWVLWGLSGRVDSSGFGVVMKGIAWIVAVDFEVFGGNCE
jgi:hypothetical protein